MFVGLPKKWHFLAELCLEHKKKCFKGLLKRREKCRILFSFFGALKKSALLICKKASVEYKNELLSTASS